jgi:hypothetical protein
VFSGNLSQPWAFGAKLAIVFTTPYTYNPFDGNLLMTVNATGTSNLGGFIFFNTNGFNPITGLNGNAIMGRVGHSRSVNSGYGLVTDFVTTPVATSEPSSLLLLGSGILGLLGTVRRKPNV